MTDTKRVFIISVYILLSAEPRIVALVTVIHLAACADLILDQKTKHKKTK